MALINCSECGNEISDKALACPKCGNPLGVAAPPPEQSKSHNLKSAKSAKRMSGKGVAFLIVVSALVIYLGSKASRETMEAPPAADSQVASAQESEPSQPVTATEAAGRGQDADAQPAPALPDPPLKLSADDLFTAYKANEVSADAKYKGKTLAVSGTVSEIGKDFTDAPYVKLSVAENQFEGVQAVFSKSSNDELAKLQKGQSITVTCTGNGMVIGTPILDCKQH